jgi:hypothetical protein
MMPAADFAPFESLDRTTAVFDMSAVRSVEARTKFPNLPSGELAVVAETGEVWLGNHAGIVCLGAL